MNLFLEERKIKPSRIRTRVLWICCPILYHISCMKQLLCWRLFTDLSLKQQLTRAVDHGIGEFEIQNWKYQIVFGGKKNKGVSPLGSEPGSPGSSVQYSTKRAIVTVQHPFKVTFALTVRTKAPKLGDISFQMFVGQPKHFFDSLNLDFLLNCHFKSSSSPNPAPKTLAAFQILKFYNFIKKQFQK